MVELKVAHNVKNSKSLSVYISSKCMYRVIELVTFPFVSVSLLVLSQTLFFYFFSNFLVVWYTHYDF